MAEDRAKRRLAAILAADVVGYSRLIEADLEGTVAALRDHRAQVLVPAVARHGGRIFKEMGDGFLVDFRSAVNAVECAVEVQRDMTARNAGVPPDRRIVFRIGVNLGDVIAEADDLHGEGVNVAARLEALAEPGGILISASVHEQVKRRTQAGFEDLGRQVLKNMSEPRRIFRLRLDPAPDTDRTTAPDPDQPAPLRLPDTPSIAILPFTNMSADAAYDHFVDGLTEDLITDVSRHPGLFVIARNSVFAYKNRPTDVRQIARDLGVRYVLEGSARRAGDRVRINAQLIDCRGGGHVWAERFDRQLADVFDLQDEVTARIRDALVGQLVAPPPRRRTRSVPAFELCARGRALLDSSFGSAEALREAMVLLEQAIDLDPDYAEAWRCLAMTRNDAWMHCGIPLDLSRGSVLDMAGRAVRLDPDDSYCRATHALLLDYAGQWDAARREHELALVLDPNNADAMVMYADFLLFAGEHDRAGDLVTRALRINPLPAAWYHMAQGKVQYAQRRYAEAVKSLRQPGTYQSAARRYLAASLAQMGRIDEARREAALFLATTPGFTIGHWLSSTAFKDAATQAHIVDGLRLAGLPD
jgi:TolB-like protein/Tfp pilus assembly protein PilF